MKKTFYEDERVPQSDKDAMKWLEEKVKASGGQVREVESQGMKIWLNPPPSWRPKKKEEKAEHVTQEQYQYVLKLLNVTQMPVPENKEEDAVAVLRLAQQKGEKWVMENRERLIAEMQFLP